MKLDFLRPYLVSRARVAALRAMVEAGGVPTSGQLHRSVEPVLGDLLPLPREALGDGEARERAGQRSAAWEFEALRRESLGEPAAGQARACAVDK